MAIDTSTETLLDPRAAAADPVFRNARTGKPAALSKVYRAFLNGCRAADGQRVRLEFIRVPGGVRTSREAISRFVQALSDPDTAPSNVMRTPARRAKPIESAERELKAAGML